MAVTLVASFGGGTSNVYVALTDAASIIETESLNFAAWTAASTANREIALLNASKIIDAVPWLGERYYQDCYNQGLAFPRTTPAIPERLWVLDETDMLSGQRTALERACAFQALYTLANSGLTLHRDNVRDGITSYAYNLGGAVSENWTYGGGKSGAVAGRWMSLCEETQRELAGYHHGRKLVRA